MKAQNSLRSNRSILCIFLLSIIAGAGSPALAQWHGSQAPDSLSVQGRLTNASGVPYDTTMDITFSLYKGPSKVWDQVQSGVVVDDGVFSVILTGGSLDTVAFNQPIDLQIEIGGKALSPNTPLTSSAYALGVRGFYAVPNTVLGAFTYKGMNVIGGASNNFIGPDAAGGTIGGGGGWSGANPRPDSVLKSWGTVSGGNLNTAGGFASTVGGGYINKARGEYSTIGGGDNNATVGSYSTVGGGAFNFAGAERATVPGGYSNQATGVAAFAAGAHARALHDGSFVWSDDLGSEAFESTAENQFLIDADGGVGIGTNSPNGLLHISSNSGDTSVWIEADSDNNEETDNPALYFRQDGGAAGAKLGFFESLYGSNVFGIAPMWMGSQYVAAITMEAATGDIGIGFDGPANPTNQLHVVDKIDGGATITNHVALIENQAATTTNGPDVLALKSSTPGGSMSEETNYITFYEGGGTTIGALEGNGTPGITLNTTSGDFAEYVPKQDLTAVLAPGQVIGLGDNGASLETDNAHRILVVTKAPAVAGNRPFDGDENAFVKAALVGQVSVYVHGNAEAGDYILASGRNDGKAIAKSPSSVRIDDLDRLIGRAWESKQPGSDQVHIEVGLDLTSVMKDIVRRQDERIRLLEATVARLEALVTN
jgi:hypothetical protein